MIKKSECSSLKKGFESRNTMMSTASMQSEKIRVMDGKDTVEFGAYENTGAKKTYVFNGQTVEETYAGPGKKINKMNIYIYMNMYMSI